MPETPQDTPGLARRVVAWVRSAARRAGRLGSLTLVATVLLSIPSWFLLARLNAHRSSKGAVADAGEDDALGASCPPPAPLPAPTGTSDWLGTAKLLADAREHGSSAVVVVVNNQVAVQEYFGHDVDGPVMMPVPRALLALAVASLVPSVDAPVVKYLENDPRYDRFLQDPTKRTITIRELLDHTSGLGGASRAFSEPLARILDEDLAFPPGAGFGYDESAADIVADVIASAADEPAAEYVAHAILKPIGVGCFDRRETPDGRPAWRMFPVDVARLGQLVLDHGRFQGKTVLSRRDVDVALPHVEQRGLAWWPGPPDARWLVHAARGDLGQDLVVVHAERASPPMVLVAVNMPGTRSGLADTEANPWFERDVLALVPEAPRAPEAPVVRPDPSIPVGDLGASVALGEAGWALGGPDARFYVASPDAETTNDGRTTICVYPRHSASGRGGTWARTIDATSLRGQRIVVRGSMKTVTRRHVGLFVSTLADGARAPLAAHAEELPAESDWATYELRMRVPANASRLQYGVAMEGNAGGLWVEGLAVTVE